MKRCRYCRLVCGDLRFKELWLEVEGKSSGMRHVGYSRVQYLLLMWECGGEGKNTLRLCLSFIPTSLPMVWTNRWLPVWILHVAASRGVEACMQLSVPMCMHAHRCNSTCGCMWRLALNLCRSRLAYIHCRVLEMLFGSSRSGKLWASRDLLRLCILRTPSMCQISLRERVVHSQTMVLGIAGL